MAASLKGSLHFSLIYVLNYSLPKTMQSMPITGQKVKARVANIRLPLLYKVSMFSQVPWHRYCKYSVIKQCEAKQLGGSREYEGLS